MSWLDAFHYRSYGAFFSTRNDPIIPGVGLPTTEIIEPKHSKVLSDSGMFSVHSCFVTA